jgi:signal peptidase I
MGQYWQKSTTLAVLLSLTIARPGWSDPPPVPAPIYSEAFCLKIFEGVVEQARSSSWKISDRDRHILNQCRSKFPPTANSKIPLPTASDCMDVVKTLVQEGLNKVKEIELPVAQVRSIERCDEVIKYYPLPSDNMLPTLKANERIVIDKIAYQTQLPQRGDIVVFNLPNPPESQNIQEPSTQRVIGLPNEKVKIKKGIVYINGQLYPEDYITESANWYESVIVPANSYFVLDDNRNNSTDRPKWNIIPRESIVGKVIWQFGSKWAF